MTVLYLLLYVVAAVCFTLVGVVVDGRVLIAAGLLMWVLVPLIHTAHR